MYILNYKKVYLALFFTFLMFFGRIIIYLKESRVTSLYKANKNWMCGAIIDVPYVILSNLCSIDDRIYS